MSKLTIPEPLAAALGPRASTELRGLVLGARPELSTVCFFAEPELLGVVGLIQDGQWITWQLAPAITEEEVAVRGHAVYLLLQQQRTAASEAQAAIDRGRLQ